MKYKDVDIINVDKNKRTIMFTNGWKLFFNETKYGVSVPEHMEKEIDNLIDKNMLKIDNKIKDKKKKDNVDKKKIKTEAKVDKEVTIDKIKSNVVTKKADSVTEKPKTSNKSKKALKSKSKEIDTK